MGKCPARVERECRPKMGPPALYAALRAALAVPIYRKTEEVRYYAYSIEIYNEGAARS